MATHPAPRSSNVGLDDVRDTAPGGTKRMERKLGWSISIARLGGTTVKLHFTFILFIAWIGGALFVQGGLEAALGGVSFLLLLFLCVLLHEFGHILAARHFGVSTPEVVLLPIGGVSRLERIPERPREELLMALAGPAVTLAIAILLILVHGGLPDPMEILTATTGRNLLAQLAYANITLFVFNLIPAFPLDGGRVLRALLSSRFGHLEGTRIAATIGKGAAILLGLVGLMAGHVILVLIAFFIFVAAGAEAGLAEIRGIALGMPAGEAMITAFESLPQTASILDATEALIQTSQRDFPVIDQAGRPIGVLTREAIITALADRSADTPVGELVEADVATVSQWDRLDDVLHLLEQGAPLAAVTGNDGRLMGIVTWENLVELLMIDRARNRRRLRVAEGLAARRRNPSGRRRPELPAG